MVKFGFKFKQMLKKNKRIIFFAFLASVSLLLLFGKDFIPGITRKLTPEESLRTLQGVIKIIRNDYVKEPNPTEIMTGAFKGLVDSLDPISSYMDEKTIDKYRKRRELNLKDTGLILFKNYGNFPVVIGIPENSPAEEKGIQIGETISAINDQSTLMMSMTEANLHLKHEEKSAVKFKVLRGSGSEEILIESRNLFTEPYFFNPQEDTSGILRIHHLFPPCLDQIDQKLLPSLKKKTQPLILDLRNCDDGDIKEALRLINYFLKADEIGYFKNKDGTKEILSCHQKDDLKHLPIIVWTNQATIGAAEIVAVVLKEFKKAPIIGTTTPGLTAKKKLFVLEDGTGLLLASSIFHMNSGPEIWLKGVKPDVDMKNSHDTEKYWQKTVPFLAKF